MPMTACNHFPRIKSLLCFGLQTLVSLSLSLLLAQTSWVLIYKTVPRVLTKDFACTKRPKMERTKKTNLFHKTMHTHACKQFPFYKSRSTQTPA